MNPAPLLDYPSDYDPLDSEEDEYGFVDIPVTTLTAILTSKLFMYIRRTNTCVTLQRTGIPEAPRINPVKELHNRIQNAVYQGNLSALKQALIDNGNHHFQYLS
jgi:hypothetical protein